MKNDAYTELDESVLQVLARTYHFYWTASEKLLSLGENYLETSKGGFSKAHPCVKIALDNAIQLNKIYESLGMTPKSRKEINKSKDSREKLDPADKFFLGKKGKVEQRAEA